VWNDLDGSGANNGAEPEIPGVVVYLDLLDNGILDGADPWVFTDSNGYYEFTDLTPGTYVVREVDPNGFTSTGDIDGPNDNTIAVQVLAGAHSPGNDFYDRQVFPANLDKELVPLPDDLINTAHPLVTIGEILTYRVTITIEGNYSGSDITVTDTLDHGLAFLRCISADVTIDSDLTVENEAELCDDSSDPNGNPSVADIGGDAEDVARVITFDLGDVDNASSEDREIVIEYEVIVLDIADNVNGVILNNSVEWSEEVGTVSAEEVEIIEPLLQNEKTVSSPIAEPGDLITFFIEISHMGDSLSDAFDVVIYDDVPPIFTYVPASLRSISGPAPTSLDDSAAPLLVVSWLDTNDLGLGETVVVAFDVILGPLQPGNSAVNTTSAEWSSFPGDRRTPPSDSHNIYSTERWYDPPSAIDIYGGITSSAVVTYDVGEFDGFELPFTGFPPDVITELPMPLGGQELEALGDLWLEIPSLQVRAPIVGIPMSEDGWDVTYLGNDIGYLNGSAFPTLSGNTVLTAHVFNANGRPGPFIYLDQLAAGETFTLHAFGQAYTYEVQSSQRVLSSDLSVLGHLEGDWITLITCAGFNPLTQSYNYRRAVHAVLVDVSLDH
jgi:LPXTG-site transpeptidase (sortase) family protein